jgi:hypothetical protein
MIIRVHDGTRSLIRSLGHSPVCAGPEVSIMFDGSFQKEAKEKTTTKGSGERRRYVGSLSHYLVLKEPLQSHVEMQDR